MTAAEMARLHALCFETPRPWSEAEFKTFRSDPTVETIAVDEGFLIVRLVASEAEILTIAVDPQHRRKGIATDLLSRFESKKSAENLFLEVSSENQSAIAFYTKSGFAKIGHRRNYYRKPDGSRIDAWVLGKSL